jgi:hypothetical protein
MTISKITFIALALALSSGSALAADAVATPPAAAATGSPNGKQGLAPSASDCKAGWTSQSAMTEDAFKAACVGK